MTNYSDTHYIVKEAALYDTEVVTKSTRLPLKFFYNQVSFATDDVKSAPGLHCKQYDLHTNIPGNSGPCLPRAWSMLVKALAVETIGEGYPSLSDFYLKRSQGSHVEMEAPLAPGFMLLAQPLEIHELETFWVEWSPKGLGETLEPFMIKVLLLGELRVPRLGEFTPWHQALRLEQTYGVWNRAR